MKKDNDHLTIETREEAIRFIKEAEMAYRKESPCFSIKGMTIETQYGKYLAGALEETTKYPTHIYVPQQ